MSKISTTVNGDFKHILDVIHEELMGNGKWVELKDSEEFEVGQIKVAVRMYEKIIVKFWLITRVNLNITLVRNGNEVKLVGIGSGGRFLLMKDMNAAGQDIFLDSLKKAISRLS